jgi:hypothetical protein
MRISAENLFVRRFDDLFLGLNARDDYEVIKLAAILRQLLLDDTPLIYKANRPHRIKLQFVVNSIVDSRLPIQPDIHFHAASIDPSMLSLPAGTKTLSLDKFLGLKILDIKTDWFTVRELIKYAANKAGGVHHGENLDARESELLRTLDKLGGLGIPTIGLALRSISRIVLTTLAPLRQLIVKLPSTLPLTAHYKINREGSIHFAGKQFLETNNYNLEAGKGFSWNGVLRAIKQPRAGKRVIYEIGSQPQARNGSKFTVYLNEKGEIGCAARLNSKTTLNVIAANSKASPIFDRFMYLSCELCLENDNSILSLWINNSISNSDKAAYRGNFQKITRQVIGGNLAGKQNAAFYIRELVLSNRCLTNQERSQLAEYFWLEWHD